MAIPGVRNFGSHIGRAEVADEVVGPNFTELWISLDPSVDYDATVAKVQAVVDGYPGLKRDLLTYLRERIKEVLTGASATVVVRIFGPEIERLQAQRRRGEEGARRHRRHDGHPGAVAGARAADRGAVPARSRGAVRAHARRRPPRGDDARAGHEGRRVLRSAARLRRGRARRAGAAAEPGSDSRAAHPGARRRATCRSAPSRASRSRRR